MGVHSLQCGSYYFQDWCDLGQLHQIDWRAVPAQQWQDEYTKERKQAECLMESSFPWELITRIGVLSMATRRGVCEALQGGDHLPRVKVKPEWYY